jgi:hypothetical protein
VGTSGERERAEKLLADGVEPIVPEAVDRWVIFLSESGSSSSSRAEVRASRFWRPFDDPVMSTLAPWLPLFDGPLHRAYKARSKER